MLRSDISGMGHVPTLSHWINSKYEGKISRFDKDILGLDVNLPEFWMDEFPAHNYKYTHLVKLLTPNDGSPLNKPPGCESAEKFDANWLDFYQLFTDDLAKFGEKKPVAKPATDDQIKRKPGLARYLRFTDGKVLNSFHMNCEPSVLAALNHYIRTQFRHPWEWVTVCSDKNIKCNLPPIADDPFDEHPKQRGVYYGVDGDGDFTNLNNIRSIDFQSNLFTASDSNSQNMNASIINLPIINSNAQLLAAVLCMCHTLQKEGSAIIQFDVNATNCTFIVGVMYLLSCIFQKAEIIRLRKFYFHGKQFKGLAKTYLAQLTKILPYYRDMDVCVPALFDREAIPNTMISTLGTIFSSTYDSSHEQKIKIYELQTHHKLFKATQGTAQ